MSIESNIVDALVAKVSAVSQIKSVKFDEIKLAIEDFADHELPAVQIWDNGIIPKHERQRVLVDWSLSLELIMRTKVDMVVNQKALFEKAREITLAIFEDPRLGLGSQGFVHLIYNGRITDLHLLQPNYIARIDVTARYYDALTGSC